MQYSHLLLVLVLAVSYSLVEEFRLRRRVLHV